MTDSIHYLKGGVIVIRTSNDGGNTVEETVMTVKEAKR